MAKFTFFQANTEHQETEEKCLCYADPRCFENTRNTLEITAA